MDSPYLAAKPRSMELGESRSQSVRSSPSMSSATVLFESEKEELRQMSLVPQSVKSKKQLSKQLSLCRTPQDIAWERRRRLERRRGSSTEILKLTDADFHELKGCIELGFGFREQNGQNLCNMLPALDLYFAVNRQLISSPSPVSTPRQPSSYLGLRSDSFNSSKSDSTNWKVCNPGDDSTQVKTRIRHWAQAVACSVMHNMMD